MTPRALAGSPARQLAGDGLVALMAALGALVAVVPWWAEGFAWPLLVVVPLGLVLVWSTLGPAVRGTVAVMAVGGVVLDLVVGVTLSDLVAAFATMATIFAFVAAVRIVEVPVSRRDYDHAAAAAASRGSWRSALWPSSLLTHMLSLALSFAALPAAYRSVRLMAATDGPAAGGVVSRAFVSANFWTPISPPLAVALGMTDLSWSGFLPVGLLLAALGMALIALGAGSRVPLVPRQVGGLQGRSWEFGALVGILLLTVVMIEHIAPVLGPIGATIVAALVVVPAWELATGGGRRLLPSAAGLVRDGAGSWRDQFALYGASGFIVAAGAHLAATGGVRAAVVASGVPLWLVLTLVPCAMTVVALFGLYPMTTLLVVVTLLVDLVSAEVALSMALVAAVLVGSAAGFVVSPTSGLTLLIAALSKHSSFEVGLRWNLPYAAALTAAGTAVVAALALGWWTT